ncbi:MAG: hypothetical protein CMG76_02455 [Candidatus Marinimicrobia bacterium]|nr:hypothetical protein [Candidatus Neomarinimicrobiota bacterium]|tara:strand:+ start:282 stop:611 length:330 start_codon:yes stop_codon:yes gene_type:complete
MKLSSIVIVIFLGILKAGFSEFVKEVDNPNGEPFMVSLGIEKNVHSFKYYNESSFYVTLPLSNIMTFKYRENVTYDEDMVVMLSDHDKINTLDKHYSLEFHLPLYKIWK